MNLKQALEKGLVLIRYHRILSFKQSCWLKAYIDFNTNKRKAATNSFEKDFYKLLNNAMFGKTIENIRNRMNLELVTKKKRMQKLISKPNFKNWIKYDDSICAVELHKENLYFDKPIYIGFTVLELSKYHLYYLHYDVVSHFFNNFKLLYLDTDSLVYDVHTNDVYDDFNIPELKKHLDMSDYPADHKCFSLENKKRLGCLKDECFGTPIVEFVGLRPKLYTFKTVDDVSKKVGKGITQPVLKKHITFDDYKTCLYKNVKIRKPMKMFRSKKHCVQTVTVNKLALSANDDKRVIMEDKINTLAYGHYTLKKRSFRVENCDIVFK